MSARLMRNCGAPTARSSAQPAAPRALKKGPDREASNEALGRSRGGFSTKIHLLCDARGNPLFACLSPGQDHESQYLTGLLEGCDISDEEEERIVWPVTLAGYKGYRADWIDTYLLDCQFAGKTGQ